MAWNSTAGLMLTAIRRFGNPRYSRFGNLRYAFCTWKSRGPGMARFGLCRGKSGSSSRTSGAFSLIQKTMFAAMFGGFEFLLMFLGCLGLPLTIFWIWALIDCAMKETDQGNTKIVWILIIIFT